MNINRFQETKNFFIKYKSVIVISILVSITVALFDIREELNQKIDELEDNVIALENEKEELEDKVITLQNEKEELKNYVNQLEDLNDNRIHQNYQSSSNQLNSGYIGNEIDESEIYSKGGKASVVFIQSGCDYIILENNQGYIVGQWMGGNEPDNGDYIAGNFNSYGTREFFNLSKKHKTRLWIDDYMLSKDIALEKINDKCN